MSDILQARVPKFLLFVAYNLPLSSSLLWSEGTNCRLGFQSKRPLFFFLKFTRATASLCWSISPFVTLFPLVQ